MNVNDCRAAEWGSECHSSAAIDRRGSGDLAASGIQPLDCTRPCHPGETQSYASAARQENEVLTAYDGQGVAR